MAETESKSRELHDTADAPWEATGAGVERKPIASANPGPADETFLCRLAPGASLPAPPAGSGFELFVLEGELQLQGGPLRKHGYARLPGEVLEELSSTPGCTLFVKSGPFAKGDSESISLQAGDDPWLPGQGGLEVKPLHSFEGQGAALVHWPAGERFLPHQHWGGEEILVLSGTFKDEHGEYPTGTWILSAHASKHHPFVTEETVIFVKTGHLPIAYPK
ncbi:MAG: quercetin dioxygenase-like cupin family protein [Planctomycetota bacterium]|jgi:quercetin dioxygenase-like cupin family protein